MESDRKLKAAIAARHSVRAFSDRPIEPAQIEELRRKIDSINAQTGFHFELCLDEPEAFCANKPHYGAFSNCRNYFALVAPKRGAGERVGYYGEMLVLLAQTLGLNTCWVALTYEKAKVACPILENEKVHDLIALGYGTTQGVQHKSRDIKHVSNVTETSPDWFRAGVQAALDAPTAINQQRFYLEWLGDNRVRAKALLGPCSKTDLGIVKLHFELGAGRENFTWA